MTGYGYTAHAHTYVVSGGRDCETGKFQPCTSQRHISTWTCNHTFGQSLVSDLFGNFKIMQSLIHNPCDTVTEYTCSQYCILENSATTASPPNNACNIAPEDRRDCGYAGIGEAGCLERGCCYDNTIPDTFWCFLKTGDEWKQKLAKKNTDITGHNISPQ